MPESRAAGATFQPRMLGPWAARAGVAFVFVAAGLEKLPPHPTADWIKMFDRIGWGAWLMYLAGVIEVVGGLFVLVPKLRLVGGGLLVAAMVGAIYFHITALGDAGSSILNLAFIAAILFASRTPQPQDEEITSLELKER